MAKYDPLRECLRNSGKDRVTLSFAEVNRIVEQSGQGGLPETAHERHQWWGNERSKRRVQARSWMEAGYRVERVDLGTKVVVFRRV